MSDGDVATKAPESDAAQQSVLPGDTPTQHGASMGEHCVTDRPTSKGTSPTGEMSNINGVEVYITKPSDYPHSPSKLLLFLTGGTGIQSVNNQLQADQFAGEGFLVVMPDQFGGDPAPNSTTDPNAHQEPSSSVIEQVKLRAAETAKSFMIDMWLARQTPEKVLPLLNKVIEGVKDEFADAIASGGGIYAVGYCFGAKYVLLLAGEQSNIGSQSKASKDEEHAVSNTAPVIKVGALAHGTLVTKEDIEGVRSPVMMVCVENDQLFPDEIREQGRQHLQTKGIEHEVKVYSGVPHGFAILGDYDDPTIQDAQRTAFDEMLTWLKELHPPGPSQSVYREECTQCFDSIDDPTGLNVCLSCFNGGCSGERNHSLLHSNRSGHPLVLNIKRTRKKIVRDEPPPKVSKLAIAAETEEDRYDTETSVWCYECSVDDIDQTSGRLSAVVDGVKKATTFAKREEVKAWEQEITPCEHTLCLEQESARRIQSQDLGHCSSCELKENLWLCLQCGSLGCGRAQFGGIGGQSHGLAHADATSHPVAVKLGSITPEGTADVYCYNCNEERTDPELATHLAHWGIDIAEREKTEKSLTEMQIDQNLRWEFSMTTEDGTELKTLFGEGFTGLKNLGNSCYLASILQCLFSLRKFQDRYYHPSKPPPMTELPAADLETQLRKLADGLLSGRYSRPDSDVVVSEHTPEVPHQKGLPPAMLKHLIGRGHEEFSTMRQQDAFELLLHLLKLITRSQHTPPFTDPVQSFRFATEQRLQCLACKRTRYRTDTQDNISIPVPIRRTKQEANEGNNYTNAPAPIQEDFEPVTLKECFDIFTGEERVELTCSGCGRKDGFTKRTLFKTFPEVLAVNARRFELVNWVPKKLDVPVLVEDEYFDLGPYMSPGPRDGEELLPEDATSGKPAAFVPDETALIQLEGMGFPHVRCEKALHATGNNGAEPAMNWLFAHMEDADIDTPINLSGGITTTGGNASIDPASIAQLGDMGISPPQAKKALRETDGDVNRALDWVFSHPDEQGDFDDDNRNREETQAPGETNIPGSDRLPANYQLQSIVCHKGGSIHAGHYVAFIRKHILGEQGEPWVLFNDEKVVQAVDVDEMKKFAYVYFFRHV